MYPIPVGLFCVPAALVALTGADPGSVVMPALNRAQAAGWLLGPVSGAHAHEAERALDDMGYAARRYKRKNGEPHHILSTWARLSAERWPGRKLLVATVDHALAIEDGRVYDTFTPFGEDGARHPYAKDVVVYVALVERRNP